MAQAIRSFICAITIFSFAGISAQTTTFEKLLKESDILYSVQEATDNGYILSGLGSDESNPFIKLIKTDIYGWLLMEKVS